MKEIVVWTHGYHFQNTRSFLFPLILFKKYFESKGLRISIFNKPHISKKKSILFIESNFFGKKLLTDHDEVIRLLKTAKKEFSKVIYFDLSDSTSLLHPQIIKYVDIYSKSQLLKDKNLSVAKVKEEIGELIESVEKNSNKIHEATDVIYHLIVYLEANDVKIEDIMSELKRRQK